MKKQIFKYLATAAGTLSLFAAIISVGTASACGMHQPNVPKALLK